MTDHARDAAIDRTLGDGNGGTRVRLIGCRLQLEGYRLAADGRMLFVDIVDSQLRAVFQILTDTGRRAGERACQADNHGFTVGCPRGRRGKAAEEDSGAERTDFYCFQCISLMLAGVVKRAFRPNKSVQSGRH